jgi:hypothetical protein
MQTEKKRNSVVTHALVTNEAGEVTGITWNVLGAGSATLMLDKIHENNRAWAEIHGWIQRGSDGAAKSRDPETGRPATPADKLAGIQRVVDHYESGAEEWEMRGGGGTGRSLTIEAIARVKGVEYEEAEAMVDRHAETIHKGDRKAALANLRQAAAVMEAMDAIRKERAPKPKADADTLLNELK